MSDVGVSSFEAGTGQDILAEVRKLMQAKAPVKTAALTVDTAKRMPAILPAPIQKTQTADPIAAPSAPVAVADAGAGSVQDAAALHETTSPKSGLFSNLRTYLLLCGFLTSVGLAAVVEGNKMYAPEMYGTGGMVPAAEAATAGQNYAVFDLNLNIRHLRDETVQRMTETPDVVLLGASHWQEAHAGLVHGLKIYNSHIHRDYWEDPLGVVDIFERYDRLPKRMIISIRDKQFTPVSLRTDYLWEPGIPYYRSMAERLGLSTEPFWKTLPYQRARAVFSLSMLFDNFTRWYNADELPHVTAQAHFKSLDTLLPDGSILWSADHLKLFTVQRRQQMAQDFAKSSLDHPPVIDAKGVEALDALLKHLKEKGVQVYLVHPPFNPEFYDAVQGSKYMDGLREIEKLTASLAVKYGFKTFGGFNPHDVGCSADQYIDAEHANPTCLKGVFDQFNQLVKNEGALQ